MLKERNSPFQFNINTPFSGLFRLEILAHVFEGEPITGMTVDILRNVSQRVFEFALGRKLSYTDEASMLKILQSVEANDHRANALMLAIVTSDQFLSQGE